jgi:hypothetical protein
MRLIKHLAILAFTVIGFFAANPAHASPKPNSWMWREDFIENHWRHLDFIPHLENGKHPQNSQWDRVTPWKAEDWIVQRGDSSALIQGFYDTDILVKQTTWHKVPLLVVGPGFYKLGGYDKRRVAQTVDKVYGITASAPDAMYLIEDWDGKPVGAYTKNGLQLQ